MRHFVSVLLLLAAASPQVNAQYNLRTEPAVPVAGQPFSVLIDESACEDSLPTPPGLPPTFTVNGNVASLAVDRIEVVNCGTDAITLSIPVPGLPAGDYTLEFVARMFEVPEISATLQAIPLTVSQGVASGRAVIPASGIPALALLGAVTVLLGSALLRRSGGG